MNFSFLTICCSNFKTPSLFYILNCRPFLLQQFFSFLPDLFRIAIPLVGPPLQSSSSWGPPPSASTLSAIIGFSFLQRRRPPDSPRPPCFCWKEALWYLDLCALYFIRCLYKFLLCLPCLCSRCFLPLLLFRQLSTTLILLKGTWNYLKLYNLQIHCFTRTLLLLYQF